MKHAGVSGGRGLSVLVRERANGSCGNFDAFPSGRSDVLVMHASQGVDQRLS